MSKGVPFAQKGRVLSGRVGGRRREFEKPVRHPRGVLTRGWLVCPWLQGEHGAVGMA